jgi:predicted N-acyltransferase
MHCQFISSINDIDAIIWNQLSGIDYPFLRHEFFAALENSGSTTKETGWEPHHLLINEGDEVIAVMPLFLKYHSYGEYVFDWAWADAFHRHGYEYYPKLLNAIPFTPATGPRWAISKNVDLQIVTEFLFNAIEQEVTQLKLSSTHVLFVDKKDSAFFDEKKYLKRTGCQYHWLNKDYQNFDQFLETFTSRKRKNLKKERQKVVDQDITLTLKTGSEITANDWHHFYLFYHLTYFKRSGRQGYLTEAFFPLLTEHLTEHLVMVQATKDGEIIAASLCFKDSKVLYGRYWGCSDEYDHLHFEACYYQGIEYAIANNIQRFDPGAQGEHKIQRGFTPIPTYSYHRIENPSFEDAIRRFIDVETDEIAAYIKQASERLPFKLEQKN